MSIVPFCLVYKLSALFFVYALFVLLFVVICLMKPKQNQGRGLVDRKHSLLAVPRGAFLFWFFADFRCGVLLFMAIF